MALLPALLLPLLPSPSTVEGGEMLPPSALIDVDRCGECHPDVLAQWRQSAHRFSSFNNPFYAAAVNRLRRRHGAVPARFCAGCHDPALLLTGKFDRLDERSAEANAGLTCLTCHRTTHTPDTTGNGNYVLTSAAPDFRTQRPLDGRSPHAESLLRPFLRTGEFCGSCHKVSIDRTVNGDRWRRGQNEYDAWHQSAVAGNSARAFYPAPEARRCQDCHMPLEIAPNDAAAKNGKVRSHRFLGANTALPHLRGDEDMLRRTEDFLRDRKVVVDVFAMRRGTTLVAPLGGQQGAPLSPGETVELEVVVRNLGVGHSFPGGTNDSNEAWLDVRVLDGDRVIAHDESHRLTSTLLDGHARPVLLRNVEDFRATAHAHAVPPGAARLCRYRFRVPAKVGDSLRVEARLQWRKFRAEFVRFARRERPRDFLGYREPPVTTVAEDAVILNGGPTPTRGDPRPAWQRWNDYGIALLAGLPEQVSDAREAFRRAGRPVDEARVEIKLGRLDRALALLDSAPASPTVSLLRAEALLAAWRFDEAARSAREVVDRLPLERDGWRLLASALGPAGRPAESIEAANRALGLDPEWADVHLLRHRALVALGRHTEADTAIEAYLRYRVDESEAALRERYLRRGGPRDNEDLAVHVHELKEVR